MSSAVVQKVIVRMLFDQSFMHHVYDQPQIALQGLSLSPHEIEGILAVDRRRWSIDQKRKDRALEGILLYTPVSVALWIEAGGKLADLLSFFESSYFHQAIHNRDWLARAFLKWLAHSISQKLDQIQINKLVINQMESTTTSKKKNTKKKKI